VETEEFVEQQVAEYAEEKRHAGHWTAGEAIARARNSIRSLIGPDPSKRGHRFFKGIEPGGRRIGWIWIGPPPEVFAVEGGQWLYQITVEPSMRGKGFGRGILDALEHQLEQEGFKSLQLNVFKWNVVARNLYESMGYEVVLDTATEAGMRKRLDGLLRPDHDG